MNAQLKEQSFAEAADVNNMYESKPESKHQAAVLELKALIGDRYVEDDPMVILSNCWKGHIGRTPNMKNFTEENVRPIAIALPASTEDVQAIIRTCCRHGLKYHVHSTGHCTFSNPTEEDVISVDMRRMDYMDIDADNQMAVIGPYTTALQIQTEAMKHGLTPHIIGAGWTYSPLASATSGWGVGLAGHMTGTNMHNILGFEYVTPEGDIVRVGSCGQGDKWFAGEGIGPGVKGVLRGFSGAMGGLGIFTRIGYKLHPSHLPEKRIDKGVHPQIGMELNNRMRIYQVAWDDWHSVSEASYDLIKSNAPTIMVRIPPSDMGAILTPRNQEQIELIEADNLPPVARNENYRGYTLITFSDTDAEAEWREKVINSIVENTGGRFVEIAQDHKEVMVRNLLTSCYVARGFRNASRHMGSSFGILESWGLMHDVMTQAEEIMKPYKHDLKVVNTGSPDQMWYWSNEGRQWWGENVAMPAPDDVKSFGSSLAMIFEFTDLNQKYPRGMEAFSLGPLIDFYHRKYFNADRWMAKVKKHFDPKHTADGYWVEPERTFVGNIWPYLNMVFNRFKGLRRWVITQSLK